MHNYGHSFTIIFIMALCSNSNEEENIKGGGGLPTFISNTATLIIFFESYNIALFCECGLHAQVLPLHNNNTYVFCFYRATKDKIEGFPTNPPTDNDLVFFDCK